MHSMDMVEIIIDLTENPKGEAVSLGERYIQIVMGRYRKQNGGRYVCVTIKIQYKLYLALWGDMMK